MKQQDVLKKIGTILNELNEQYEYLKNEATQLNELELELFVANIQFLKDHTAILSKLNAQSIAGVKQTENIPVAALPVSPPVKQIPPHVKAEPQKSATVQEEKFFEPVVQQLKPAFNKKPVKAVEPPYINIEAQKAAETEPVEIRSEKPGTIRHELVVDDSWAEEEDRELYDAEDIIEVEEEVQTVKEPEIETVKEPEPVIAEKPAEIKSATIPEAKVADDKKEAVVTINQRMSDQIGERKSPVQQPVTDLKTAVTLNDKLLFVKDLFNGYSLAYSEALEILNRFNSFEDAERFLNVNYVVKNNWESKPTTAKKFYDLLKRRYS